MTSRPSITTVAFCSVSSTRGRIKTPRSFRPLSSPVRKACNLSMLVFFPLECQNNFSAITGFHNPHRFVKPLKGQGMGNHLLEIELAAFEDTARTIPGIEDAPPGNAHDGRTLEDDVVGQIKLDHARGNTEHRDTPTVAQSLEALANRGGMARHLQHDIDPQPIGRIQNRPHRIDLARIEGIAGPHVARDIQALVIRLDRKDGARARDMAEANRPQADGATADHRHRFIGNFARIDGVHGIAKRLLDGGDAMLNLLASLPGNAGGNGDILRESAIAVHADNLDITADVALSGATLVALATGNMSLRGDKITRDKRGDFTPNLYNHTRKFMSEDTRDPHATLCPGIPLI